MQRRIRRNYRRMMRNMVKRALRPKIKHPPIKRNGKSNEGVASDKGVPAYALPTP